MDDVAYYLDDILIAADTESSSATPGRSSGPIGTVLRIRLKLSQVQIHARSYRLSGAYGLVGGTASHS